MWVSKYFIEFIIFGFLGWVWETIFCTLKGGKWENRGFLFGPICPIYGVGAVAALAVIEIFHMCGQQTLSWWEIFIISFLGSIVLEYFTSWGLERLFHAYWWDYSKEPFNIKGRVCLQCSLAFGVAGLVIVYVLAPICNNIMIHISPVAMELLALIFALILSSDITLTVSALTGFDKQIKIFDSTINDYMTDLFDNMYKTTSSSHRHALRRVKGFRYPKAIQPRVQGVLEKVRAGIRQAKK